MSYIVLDIDKILQEMKKINFLLLILIFIREVKVTTDKYINIHLSLDSKGQKDNETR